MRQFQHQGIKHFLMHACVLTIALLPKEGHLLRNPLSEQAYLFEWFGGSHIDHQFQSLTFLLGENGQQIEPLFVAPEHDPGFVAQQEVDALLDQTAQPQQSPVA